MQFGLHIADFTFDSGPAQLGPTLARHVRHAEDAGIQRITVMDHFWQLPGIGPVRKKRLLRHFRSITDIQKASLEELEQIIGHRAGAVFFHHIRTRNR
jgi:hypothetical protein